MVNTTRSSLNPLIENHQNTLSNPSVNSLNSPSVTTRNHCETEEPPRGPRTFSLSDLFVFEEAEKAIRTEQKVTQMKELGGYVVRNNDYVMKKESRLSSSIELSVMGSILSKYDLVLNK
jgi:hypothetical protein